MEHIKTIINSTIKVSENASACSECQTSCQSACKTSCTVANQPCEREAEDRD
ncbi:MAG: six-cysteine peptide SCIFF [Fastidiosipila sp.]|nr:six-cysteine peptide SCIFF [Fastidiosipila sp.]